jgi:hypothetical protein
MKYPDDLLTRLSIITGVGHGYGTVAIGCTVFSMNSCKLIKQILPDVVK